MYGRPPFLCWVTQKNESYIIRVTSGVGIIGFQQKILFLRYGIPTPSFKEGGLFRVLWFVSALHVRISEKLQGTVVATDPLKSPLIIKSAYVLHSTVLAAV